MVIKRTFLLLTFTLCFFCEASLIEKFQSVGFVEICDEKYPQAKFDSLYEQFDELIDFLQTNRTWAQKLHMAKEQFIRSKDKNFYSTNFFGFYDESKREGRNQISFYYSSHFHAFVCSRYPEFNQVPEIIRFFETCYEIQKSCESLFHAAANQLQLQTLFSSNDGKPPILFKVVKYLPSYIATRPHYDGTAFSLFLDSTDDRSLLLSPYKSVLATEDFSSPLRAFPKDRSILLIPGAQLAEFSIKPTPHIVMQSSKNRYATIAFAMRPNYTPQKEKYAILPHFRN